MKIIPEKIHKIKDTPEANPSKPSNQLNPLVNPTIKKTVIR